MVIKFWEHPDPPRSSSRASRRSYAPGLTYHRDGDDDGDDAAVKENESLRRAVSAEVGAKARCFGNKMLKNFYESFSSRSPDSSFAQKARDAGGSTVG